MRKLNSFERGFCRAFDMGAKNKAVFNITVRYRDIDAVTKDWENVGKDIRKAASNYRIRECR